MKFLFINENALKTKMLYMEGNTKDFSFEIIISKSIIN